jgi:hypothetical protein
LQDKAHGVVPTHEIFNKPFKVNFKLEDVPTPADYLNWPHGRELGKTMKMWQVQSKTFPQIDGGMVSDPYGLGDSPDTEKISSGVNSKGPEAAAIARQGNYLLWGFSASPSDMTPEARKSFLNAVCYIKRFDGQRPLVRAIAKERSWALVYSSQANDSANAAYLKDLFPEALRQRFGNDLRKYSQYYQENLEYLHPVRGRFEVDEEVKSLGVSNRKVDLLEHCIDMLAKGEKPELALRILKRYTFENFVAGRQWRDWLDKNQQDLFFSDRGGYKFMVASPGWRHGKEDTAVMTNVAP